MKSKYRLNIYFSMIVCLTSACGFTMTTNKPTKLDPQATVTLTEQMIVTQLPTQTSEMAIATAPAMRPTLTNSPPSLPTATMTPLATLEAEQARETINAFLENGGNCTAPCFLGIMPEISTLSEAIDRLTHLGLSITKITNQGRDFYDTNYEFDNRLSMSGHLAAQDEMIMKIEIGINLPTETGYPRDWSAFSPETLISLYGQPSRVSFATDWGPRSYFEMNLYFDAVHLIVEYTGYNLITRQEGPPLICPLSMPFSYVRIWMGKEPDTPPLAAIPLEKATSMTIEEFVELMTGNPDQACFTLNDDESP